MYLYRTTCLHIITKYLKCNLKNIIKNVSHVCDLSLYILLYITILVLKTYVFIYFYLIIVLFLFELF